MIQYPIEYTPLDGFSFDNNLKKFRKYLTILPVNVFEQEQSQKVSSMCQKRVLNLRGCHSE